MTDVDNAGQPAQDLRVDALLDPLLTTGDVAAIFRVDPKTVTRWRKAGKIGGIKTLGGQHRFRESMVRDLLESSVEERSEGTE